MKSGLGQDRFASQGRPRDLLRNLHRPVVVGIMNLKQGHQESGSAMEFTCENIPYATKGPGDRLSKCRHTSSKARPCPFPWPAFPRATCEPAAPPAAL